METIENNVQSINGDSHEQEMEKLKPMGDALVKQSLWQCNIFGGEEACSNLSGASGQQAQCPGQNSRVDCAFKGGAEDLTDRGPGMAMNGEYTGSLSALPAMPVTKLLSLSPCHCVIVSLHACCRACWVPKAQAVSLHSPCIAMSLCSLLLPCCRIFAAWAAWGCASCGTSCASSRVLRPCPPVAPSTASVAVLVWYAQTRAQHSTVQCSTVQYSTVQHTTLHYTTLHYITERVIGEYCTLTEKCSEVKAKIAL